MSDQNPSAPTPPPASPYVPPTPTAGPKQGLSLTSFIMGIASVVFTWIPVLGFLVAVAAIILGFIGKGKEPAAPKWMWMVGVITGFVGAVLGIIIFVTIVILPLVFLSSVGSLSSY